MPKYVDIFDHRPPKAPILQLRTILDDQGAIVFDGPSASLRTELEAGIKLGAEDPIFPADGEVFLEALQFKFSSAYRYATEIKIGNPPPINNQTKTAT